MTNDRTEPTSLADPTANYIALANVPQTVPDNVVTAPVNQLANSLDELIHYLGKTSTTLQRARQLVATDTFKYLSPDRRKVLIDELVTKADKVDDMACAVIKGMRQVKRVRLRDDDLIADLAHNWAITVGFPIDQPPLTNV